MKIIKFVKAFFAGAALITASVGSAFAQTSDDTVKILDATYSGRGCPTNTVTVTPSLDFQILSIQFNQYIAVANNQAQSYRTCNLVIPIKLPQGIQVSFYDADYRGYVSPATTGKLQAEYFFFGPGPVFTRNVIGESDYFVRDSLVTYANIWSRCGATVNMQVNTSMRATGIGKATVGSPDLAQGLVFHLRYRSC
ncbi:MAG: DUF4360 domain-containing protein [Nostoc sp.]|uniref:DUF4360 domain-containing protein n=1 Tax=Nostoc sp. TaxID=1180 RepID=UPI002FF98FFA